MTTEGMTENWQPSREINSAVSVVRRQNHYDLVRRLFDTTNEIGLQVAYVPEDEDIRPGQAERLINALIEIDDSDVLMVRGNLEYPVKAYFTTPQLNVRLRFFSRQTTSPCPEGIGIDISSFGQGSYYRSVHCGILMPDGSAHTGRFGLDRMTKHAIDSATLRVQLAFELFKNAHDEGRLKPAPLS